MNRRKGIELARQALQAAADDPNVLGKAAFALGYFGEDIDTAIALIDRALALNPSFARGWQWSGWLSGCGPGNPISRSSISRPRCASTHASSSANPFTGNWA